jgi:signal transduction histidine kinase
MSLRRAMEKRRQSKQQAVTVSKLNMISEEVEKTLQIARRVASELRPAVLDSLGLAAAVEWQTREFEERSSIFCNITLPEESVELDPERGTAVFRIFQEVLTNIVRHARATEVSVVLRMTPEAIVLEISDNGVGIESSKRSHLEGHGLLGIQERALAAGLRVDLTSESGEGTRTTIEIPTGARA